MDEFELRYKNLKLYDGKTEHLRFHGTNFYFEKIDLKYAKGYKDFGPGFYLAEKYYHAESRALQNIDADSAYVYVYAVPKTFVLPNSTHFKLFHCPSLDWLDFIMENRDYKSLHHNFEVVIGPTADANAVALINKYQKGGYGAVGTIKAKEALIKDLKVYRYSNQTCLCSYNAIKQIRRIDTIRVK